MNAELFSALVAQGYNRIPVAREVLADLDTPLSVYLKLADGPYSYLLESVHGGEKWGRYSMIGLPARSLLRVRGHTVTLETAGEVVERATVADPLAWIEAFHARYRVPDNLPGLPRFAGGLVGYFGYDIVRYVEARLATCPNPDPLDNPDVLLLVSEDVVVFDNLAGRLYVITQVDPAVEDYARAEARLDALVGRLRDTHPRYRTLAGEAAEVGEQDFQASFTREGFEAAVRRIQAYIHAGDCMQVVPSQRMSIPFGAEPLDLYRALRTINPSPYMFFFNFGDFHVVGSSPEILTRVEDGLVTVRPIAGTRPRGATPEADRQHEVDLLADPKERAEHVMLIDLERNDLGRVCRPGTVRVDELMVLERYAHVHHIVSNVRGELRAGITPGRAIRAVFPGGTITGCPKVRCMEIIAELEGVGRGPYTGAMGYLNRDGDLDLNILIRTLSLDGERLRLRTGAGIVYDSVPARELDETRAKARGVLLALGAPAV